MISISLPLLLATIATFILALIALNKILYQPILSFIDKRDRLIEDDLKNAQENSNDISNMHQEANKIISQAKMEVQKIRASAIEDAKKNSSKSLEEKRVQLDAKFSNFLTSLESERADLRNGLLKMTPLLKEELKLKITKL